MFQAVEIAHAKTLREELETERHSVWPENNMGGGSVFRNKAGQESRSQLFQSVANFSKRFVFFY